VGRLVITDEFCAAQLYVFQAILIIISDDDTQINATQSTNTNRVVEVISCSTKKVR
jgi:hypothetical protein